MLKKLHASIIVTYRCNARCNMCDVWHYPTKPAEEIGLDVIRKLPEIISGLRKKAKRIVISTNGYWTDRIIELCRKFPDLGIRISIEGSPESNDRIRGIPDGYRRTQETLRKLQEMGQAVKDCKKNCWMIGSVAPAMRHHPVKPVLWVIRGKLGVVS